MRWLKSSITHYQQGDFIPIVIGCVFLFLSLPGFIVLLIDPEQGAPALVVSLLVFFAIGIVLGLVYLVFGIRLCSYPGSLAYRLTHGWIFSR